MTLSMLNVQIGNEWNSIQTRAGADEIPPLKRFFPIPVVAMGTSPGEFTFPMSLTESWGRRTSNTRTQRAADHKQSFPFTSALQRPQSPRRLRQDFHIVSVQPLLWFSVIVSGIQWICVCAASLILTKDVGTLASEETWRQTFIVFIFFTTGLLELWQPFICCSDLLFADFLAAQPEITDHKSRSETPNWNKHFPEKLIKRFVLIEH